MPGPVNNVLRDCPRLTQNSYRAAVAGIVNAIKSDFNESDKDVADELGVSPATINNASNKVGDLNAVTLLRIGQRYGLGRLGPVIALIGATVAAADGGSTEDDQLPVCAARGQLFLAEALADKVIDDAEILAGAEAIESAFEAFGQLKWRLDGLRARKHA